MATTRGSTKRKNKDREGDVGIDEGAKEADESSVRSYPNEVLLQILQQVDKGSLSQCMRVSKSFYGIVGPMLYTKIVVKHLQPFIKIAKGWDVSSGSTTNSSSNTVNLKIQLLSLVQHLTVATHTECDYWRGLPSLKTLLIIPFADDWANESICPYKRCPMLQNARPHKVVIHNSRVNRQPLRHRIRGIQQSMDSSTAWPMPTPPLAVTCPIMTLFLDETACGVAGLPRHVGYPKVHWYRIQQLRIIVCKTPAWLDVTAQRESSSTAVIDVEGLATRILGPAMRPALVPTTIYLFRNIQQDERDRVALLLARELNQADDKVLQKPRKKGVPAPQRRPAYTIKGLSDYIAEGWEDELIWQELNYWREENERRLLRNKASLEDDLV